MEHKDSSIVKFKNDKFKKNRGGYSRWLKLNCEKCKIHLMIYQKDGTGILKRLYLDRVVSPKNIVKKQKLECDNCKTILGVVMLYERENRPAYRLFAGAIGKKIVKGNKVTLNL